MTPSSSEPIFVGGSGRCGTTVLAKTLGLHARIFTFPDELECPRIADAGVTAPSATPDDDIDRLFVALASELADDFGWT